MGFHPILAHGSLGSWDEIVFLSIAVIFLVMMGISWVRSRSNSPAESSQTVVQPTEPTPDPESPDHFTLS